MFSVAARVRLPVDESEPSPTLQYSHSTSRRMHGACTAHQRHMHGVHGACSAHTCTHTRRMHGACTAHARRTHGARTAHARRMHGARSCRRRIAVASRRSEAVPGSAAGPAVSASQTRSGPNGRQGGPSLRQIAVGSVGQQWGRQRWGLRQVPRPRCQARRMHGACTAHARRMHSASRCMRGFESETGPPFLFLHCQFSEHYGVRLTEGCDELPIDGLPMHGQPAAPSESVPSPSL